MSHLRPMPRFADDDTNQDGRIDKLQERRARRGDKVDRAGQGPGAFA